MFDTLVKVIETMPQYGTGCGRGYPLSVWFGYDYGPSFVIDYDQDIAMRVQEVGAYTTFYREDV